MNQAAHLKTWTLIANGGPTGTKLAKSTRDSSNPTFYSGGKGSPERLATLMAVDGSHPVIECDDCGRVALIRKMAVTYQASIDMDTRDTVHRRAGVKYDLQCPHGGHSLAVTVDDPES